MSTSASYGRSGMSKSEAANDAADRVREGVDAAKQGASDLVGAIGRNAGELADTVSDKLRTVGVDPDVMVSEAKRQAGELQAMLSDELRRHPVRALGVAAAVGLVIGLLTARR
jgi:ElaB/YqjD/DUF883 family membrane-anchored ribosome-binding protein